jgi:hypothetical protein
MKNTPFRAQEQYQSIGDTTTAMQDVAFCLSATGMPTWSRPDRSSGMPIFMYKLPCSHLCRQFHQPGALLPQLSLQCHIIADWR